MLERAVQKRYIDFISGKVEIPQPKRNPIRIYKELVHYRFYEVIKNAMPDFCEILGEDRLDRLIFEFIQFRPKSPFVWQVPMLFREFLLEYSRVEDIEFAADLMWFESVEVELLMGEYEKPKEEAFSWDLAFKPSRSMRMRMLNYAVNRDEFDHLEAHPLVMYYHFKEHSVFFQEITPFMMQFLFYLKKMLPYEALEKICIEFSMEEMDEVKSLLQGALDEFTQLNILQSN